MKYAIDRIEDDIVVLENIETKEKRLVNKELFSEDIADGIVVKVIEDKYVIDSNSYDERRQKIREKMDKLKRLKDRSNE